ncbi:hypothetical protein AVEN_27269-1 [Araneus ventricosus]|uniref:Uncharacterized protein n=1 Tax=Araneus ventricosus TaxID=182803 RepID=A0A4Y2UCZ7_ARAVE|nr:hypothetical protein AVEN_250118-1 [Araneus ventricosus]GBO09975.1 hypothetical protein AVEN_27269-1 [Araneus ventricosus]
MRGRKARGEPLEDTFSGLSTTPLLAPIFYRTAYKERSTSLSVNLIFKEIDSFWEQPKNVVYETTIESPEEIIARISVAVAGVREMSGIFQHARDSLNRWVVASGLSVENLL